MTAKETRGFSLVLLGAMNPALHHPTWYQSIGALSPEEVEQALAREFVFVPQIAQFQTDTVQVTCDPQRWQASADLALVSLVRKIAAVAFDERLTETPIRAVGVNFNFHIATTCDHVGRRISEFLSSLPFGFEAAEATTGKLSFTRPVPGGALKCEIEPSIRGDNIVYVGFNGHYPLEVVPEPTQFSLGELFDRRYEELGPLVEAQLVSVTRVLGGEANS